MNEDLKKIAKYLAAKIDNARDEILEEMEARFTQLEEVEEEDTEDEDFNELDDESEEIEETTEDISQQIDKIPEIFDVEKRKMVTEKEEPKKKKKGFFGRDNKK